MRSSALTLFASAVLLAGCHSMPLDPTAVDFGDSTSKPYAADARYDLYGKVDLRHDPFDKGDIVPSTKLSYLSAEVEYSTNAGYSTTLLEDMEQVLVDHSWYNVLIYNSGYHDVQRLPTQPVGSINVPQAKYRDNMEAIAQLAEQHAGIVIWVDTPGIRVPVAPVGTSVVDQANIPIYNAIARAVAKEHGFYMLSLPDAGHDGSVHFTHKASLVLGQFLADCVLTALDGAETSDCHK